MTKCFIKNRLAALFLPLFYCLLLSGCASPPPAALSDHFDGEHFYNPHLKDFKKSIWQLIRLRYFSDLEIADHQATAYLVPTTTPGNIQSPALKKAQITWLGHASFLIQYQGVTILTDPIFSDRASPLSFWGPKRLQSLPVALADLPPIDYVLISHNHYDHLDAKTIATLGNQPKYLVPLGLRTWFTARGIAPEQVSEFDWWQQQTFAPVTVTATPSQHWSGRTLTDRFDSLWAAWHIDIAGFSVWFAGDTGYNPVQFKAVGEKWRGVDVALIPIGAYHPRSFLKEQHVDPKHAIQIHQDVRAKRSIGMHWGTFQLSAEPIDEPPQKLSDATAEGQLRPGEFTTMAIGETRSLN